MVVVQASKLNLPSPSLSSMLFEPSSHSLALRHSDSSFSLFHSLSDLSSSSSHSLLARPRTVVPSPSSSSCFLSIQNPNRSDSRTLFVVSGPHDGGSRIYLRFYALIANKGFSRIRVVCNQKGIEFDERVGGVLVNYVHGVSIKLSGSVNFFAMNSASCSEVWIFAARLVDDGIVKLMRCAVIECRKPVFSIGIFFGLLVLGEENGVRVFSMRQLVKGRVRKVKTLPPKSRLDNRRLRLPNGVVGGNKGLDSANDSANGGNASKGNLETSCRLDEKKHKNVSSAKQRAIRLQQDSSEVGTCFVAFSTRSIEAAASTVVKTLKATSIQALSQKKFLILDSTGNLHLMGLSNSVIRSDITPQMQQLPRVMNVQKLAVLADSSTETQTLWVSDGSHSLHRLLLPDLDAMTKESDSTEKPKSFAHISVSVAQAIFACEKIEDVTPLDSNGILILGQGGLYTYEVS